MSTADGQVPVPITTSGRDPDQPIRVLLVDDHAVVREGMRALLDREAGIEVVGEAEDGEQAVRAADQLRPPPSPAWSCRSCIDQPSRGRHGRPIRCPSASWRSCGSWRRT